MCRAAHASPQKTQNISCLNSSLSFSVFTTHQLRSASHSSLAICKQSADMPHLPRFGKSTACQKGCSPALRASSGKLNATTRVRTMRGDCGREWVVARIEQLKDCAFMAEDTTQPHMAPRDWHG